MSVNVCIVCDSKNYSRKNVTQENAKVFPFKTPLKQKIFKKNK